MTSGDGKHILKKSEHFYQEGSREAETEREERRQRSRETKSKYRDDGRGERRRGGRMPLGRRRIGSCFSFVRDGWWWWCSDQQRWKKKKKKKINTQERNLHTTHRQRKKRWRRQKWSVERTGVFFQMSATLYRLSLSVSHTEIWVSPHSSVYVCMSVIMYIHIHTHIHIHIHIHIYELTVSNFI